MSFERRKAEFEERVRALTGERIARVRYATIDYGGGSGCWEREGVPLHVLDFGLELGTATGRRFSALWDGEFHQYGFQVKEARILELIRQPSLWELTDNEPWRSFLHREVEEVEVYWSRVEYQNGASDPSTRQIHQTGRRIYYPQDAVLRFVGGGRLYLSAAAYVPERDELLGGSDEVAVIFSEDVARRYRVGPHADDSKTPPSGQDVGL